MEIQGSSLTPLQRQIMTAFINAGGSYDGGPAVQPVRQPIVDESNRIQRQQDNNELREQMVALSKKLQEEMEKASTNIDFSYNDDIKALVVTVREPTGQRVIREIPSQEAIELMRKMREMVGNIFDEYV